jgi:hypothetical protein
MCTCDTLSAVLLLSVKCSALSVENRTCTAKQLLPAQCWHHNGTDVLKAQCMIPCMLSYVSTTLLEHSTAYKVIVALR